MEIALIALHVLICIFLILIVLIQSGRGGGLLESLSGVESMFGTKTNALLTRTTTVLSTLFFLTCLSLALFSAHQSQSLLKNVDAPAAQTGTAAAPAAAEEATAAATQAPTATPEKPAAEPQAPKTP